MSRRDKGIPQGRVRRTAPIAALTARTAGEAVVVALRRKATGTEDPDFHARSAERYAELLGRSKGALMKAGQLLSFTALGPTVPSEFATAYQSALSRLRADVPPMPEALVRPVLEQELGRRTEAAFAQFDWTPLAAASIGQVHAGRLLDGRRVAVKVQYPGVADAIRADLRNTELLATFMSLLAGLSPRRVSLDVRGVADELGERIMEELDYRTEAAYQAEFAGYYAGHPFINVPTVITELSGECVLTQELAEGRSWEEALQANVECRNRWGEVLCRFVYGSQSRYGVFHADPHPGNYLFHDDGSITALDFGCVKRMSREQLDQVYAILRAELAGDEYGTWRASVDAGFYAADGPVTPREVYEYWHDGDEMYWGEQPFTVTPEYAATAIEQRYSPTGPSGHAYRNSTAPGELATLVRIDTGLVSLLGALRATNDWKSMIAETIRGAEPTTELGRREAEFLAGREPAGRV